MDRKRAMLDGVLFLAVLALSGLAWSQHAELTRLDESVALMEARVDAVESGPPRSVVLSAEQPSVAALDAPPARPPRHAAVDRAPIAQAQPVAPATPNAAAAAAQLVEDPAVRGQLREVIAEEQQALQEERWQQRTERRAERLKQQVSDLADRTEMDPQISEQLTDMLLVEQAEVSDVFRKAREDFSWDDAREKSQAVREETDAKAKDLLSDDEYTEYTKMREEEAARWTGGRRGPRTTGSGARVRGPRPEPR